MYPFYVLGVMLFIGYVVARVIISNRQYKRKPKSYLMIVKHSGQEFGSSTIASSRVDAETKLHQEICQQIREAGLNPFDGSTEYRLFGETLTEILPDKMMVFRPERQ
jgi:predicted RNA binding protein YcfA (HicA-like mRNA interferase family)